MVAAVKEAVQDLQITKKTRKIRAQLYSDLLIQKLELIKSFYLI